MKLKANWPCCRTIELPHHSGSCPTDSTTHFLEGTAQLHCNYLPVQVIDKPERKNWLTVTKVLAFCYVQTPTLPFFHLPFPRKIVRGTGYLILQRKKKVPTHLHKGIYFALSFNSNFFSFIVVPYLTHFPSFIFADFWKFLLKLFFRVILSLLYFLLSLSKRLSEKLFLLSFRCRVIHSMTSIQIYGIR